MMHPLEMATTQALTDELSRPHRSCVVAAIREEDGENVEEVTTWTGSRIVCLGLAERLSFRINEAIQQSAIEKDMT